MTQYKVRSRALVDMVKDINDGSMILSPFFQRKLVWRLAHKVDFIKTILLRYPFPEIFTSRGTLDVDTMRSTSCIVDGQQRMNAIKEFIEGVFEVEGLSYAAMTPSEKEQFLKYEIAIIDLDLPQNDPTIIEIFKRLNRTFYALSTIERYSTEYGSSEFMLVAKLLCGELRAEEHPNQNIDPNRHLTDPNISQEFTLWGNQQDITQYMKLVLDSPTFSKYEIQRQVHLMFTLNLMATLMFGFYARNEQVIPHLELYGENFPEKDSIVHRINSAAQAIMRLKFPENSIWFSKSNAFSLLLALDAYSQPLSIVPVKTLRNVILRFSANMPDDYALAAREAVNNKRERILRGTHLTNTIKEVLPIE
jgi:hypothetical protein